MIGGALGVTARRLRARPPPAPAVGFSEACPFLPEARLVPPPPPPVLDPYSTPLQQSFRPAPPSPAPAYHAPPAPAPAPRPASPLPQRAAPMAMGARLVGLVGDVRGLTGAQGYPASVSADYLTYQKWDSLQALCSSVTGMLSTLAILKGVGVGNEEASPAAAAMQWAIRDGASKVGTIVFCYLQGTNLDQNAKTWRFAADVLNDAAIAIEMVSALFPRYFLLLACLGSVTRAVVGVAGGATRAAFVVHQARRGNTADVQAKDNSQETAVSLTGLLLGMLVTPLVGNSTRRAWGLFFAFTLLHLFFNYMAITSMSFDTLNRQRAALAARHFFRTDGAGVPSPAEVARHERILYFESLGAGPGVDLGARLLPLTRRLPWDTLREALDGAAARGDEHAVVCAGGRARVLISAAAGPEEPLRAYFHACALRFLSPHAEGDTEAARDYAGRRFEGFCEALRAAGWRTEHCRLGEGDWRYSWK
eukprot:tig00000147_g9498.t1